MILPKQYDFINTIGVLPKLLSTSLQYLGLKEYTGISNNPVIMNMSKTLGLQDVYLNDEMSWCALYHSFLCHLVGKPLNFNSKFEYLRAKSFINWGNKVELDDIKLGDTVVLERVGGGHVFLAIGESKDTVHGLGGNQANSVCFEEFDKSRIVAVRNLYQIGKPASAIKYNIDRLGLVSSNEA